MHDDVQVEELDRFQRAPYFFPAAGEIRTGEYIDQGALQCGGTHGVIPARSLSFTPNSGSSLAMPGNLEAIAREMERQYGGAVAFEHSRLTVDGKGIGF